MPKPMNLVTDPAAAAAACCAPLDQAPLTVSQAEEIARVLKAVADPTRLRLLSLLLASEGREACTCDLTGPLGLSQPTVTHHLKKLAETGVVVGERRGRFSYYRVAPEALAGVAAVLAPLAA